MPYITAGSRSVGYTVNKPFEMESQHVNFSMANLYYFLYISKCFFWFVPTGHVLGNGGSDVVRGFCRVEVYFGFKITRFSPGHKY